MPLAPIPDDKLRATFERARAYRPHWPATYGEAMADPIIARCIDMLTRYVVPSVHRRAPPPRQFVLELEAVARAHLEGKRMPDGAPCDPLPDVFRTRRTMPLDGKMLAAGEKPEPD